MDTPRVSVIVATLNRAHYLKRMLDNLLADDYPNKEIIVVDGGSRDGTVSLLKEYSQRLGWWVSEADGGEYFALVKGLTKATGDVIKFMSDDDVLRPGSFKAVVAYFNEHPSVGIGFGGTAYWSREPDGSYSYAGTTNMTDESRLALRHYLRETHGICSTSAFIRREVIADIGPLSTDYAAGDIEYWARAASHGIRMGLLPEILVDYYITGENGVVKKWQRLSMDMVRINARYGEPLDVAACIARKVFLDPFITWTRARCHRYGVHPIRTIQRVRSLRSPGGGVSYPVDDRASGS